MHVLYLQNIYMYQLYQHINIHIHRLDIHIHICTHLNMHTYIRYIHNIWHTYTYINRVKWLVLTCDYAC